MTKKNEFDDDIDEEDLEEDTEDNLIKESTHNFKEVEVNLSLINQKLNYIINQLALKK